MSAPSSWGAADESKPSDSTVRELCFWSLWATIAGGSGISDRQSPSLGTCSWVAEEWAIGAPPNRGFTAGRILLVGISREAD